MELKEASIQTRTDLETLLSKLRSMQFKRELKLVRGSFDDHGVIDAEFKLKNSSEHWQLYCTTEIGGGYLKKI